MAAAVPIVVPAADVFKHPGDPDVAVATAFTLLDGDPVVELTDCSHALVSATPFAGWTTVAGANVDDPPIGMRVSQKWIDLWGFEVAQPSQWFEDLSDALSVSVRPQKFHKILEALTLVGGLQLEAAYESAAVFVRALSAAGREAAADVRLKLEEADCFVFQPYLANSLTSRHSYMGKLPAATMCAKGSCAAIGRLGFALRPKFLIAGRVAAGSGFSRVLEAVRTITGFRSEFLLSCVEKPSGHNAEEVAELVADTWCLIQRHALVLCDEVRPVQRALAIELAARLALGGAEKKASAFLEVFPDELAKTQRVLLAVDGGYGEVGDVLGRWEQLAGVFAAGVEWRSSSCLSSVESALKEWVPTLVSLQGVRGGERMLELRKAVAAGKGTRLVGAPSPGEGAQDQQPAQGIGRSGLEAMRNQAFIATRDTVRGILATPEPDVTELFDTLLASESKVFYMLAVGQLKKQTGSQEIQDCCAFMPDFGKYWLLTLASEMAEDDEPLPQAVLREKVSDADVAYLQAGDWHRVGWVKLANSIELWLYGVTYDGPTAFHVYETLMRVRKILYATFRMLRLDVESALLPGELTGVRPTGGEVAEAAVGPGAEPQQEVSFKSLFKRIVALQRKSGVIPKASKARKDHHTNVSYLVSLLLETGGQRWQRQFRGEVNFNAPLQRCFLTDSSFVLGEVERKEAVARQLFDLKDVLPHIFDGQWNGGKEGEQPDDADLDGMLLSAEKPKGSKLVRSERPAASDEEETEPDDDDQGGDLPLVACGRVLCPWLRIGARLGCAVVLAVCCSLHVRLVADAGALRQTQRWWLSCASLVVVPPAPSLLRAG
jgi:hypothetical protein